MKGKTHRGYHWVYHSPPKRLVLFDYRPGRNSDGLDEILQNYKGFLQTDGYVAYDKFKYKEHVTHVGCMAHARRYYEKALGSDHERASHMLALIQQLYALERTIRESGPVLNDEQVVAMRQSQAAPVMQQMKQWIDDHINVITPASPLGYAITYMAGHRNKLTVYLQHAFLNIDNNLVENAIRPTVVGRKNYLFSGSHDGARRSAMFYSFMGSCKMNQINPEQWFVDVLEKLPGTKASELYTLLPNFWKPTQA